MKANKVVAAMDDRAHHPYSPSQLESIELCPGRVAMCRDLPDRAGDAAVEGTRLHAAMAMLMLDPNSAWDEGLGRDQKELVRGCEDFVVEILRSGSGMSYYVEKTLSLLMQDGSVLTEGTPDLYVLDDEHREATVIDYKFGWGEIEEAANNLQMAALAAMVWRTHPNMERVRCVLLQARLHSKSEHVFEGVEVFSNIIGQVEKIVKRASAPDAPRIPGKKQCQYCRGLLQCPEAIEAGLSENRLTIPQGQPCDVAQSEAKLGLAMPDLLERAGLCEILCKEIHARAEALVRGGHHIPGWSLRPGNMIRKVQNIDLLYSIMSELGCTPGDFVKVCSVKIGDCEALGVDRMIARAKAAGEALSKKAAVELLSRRMLDSGAVAMEQQKDRLVKEKKK